MPSPQQETTKNRSLFNIAGDILRATGIAGLIWKFMTYLMTHQRSLLVMFVVLPLSLAFDFYNAALNWYNIHVKSSPKDHQKRVSRIQNRVQEWINAGKPTPMCTARPGWLTASPRHASYKNQMWTVNLNLTDILELDLANNTVKVEPMVTVKMLLDYLLPRGVTLPVVPEMDELTIGGLVSGYGIETTSHVHGLLSDIAIAYEIVLPDASVRRVTRGDKLFHQINWSFGTLGFLTAIELPVIKASRFVRHEYIPIYSKQDIVQTWTKYQTASSPPDFLEGIQFSENEAVICVGHYENEVKPGDVINDVTRWWTPYFFKQCERYLRRHRRGMELIPLKAYYRRHNRSVFWVLQDQIPISNNPLFRLLFGWALPPRVPFLKLIESDEMTKFYETNYVIQDLLVPVEALEETITECERKVAVYPVWICGFKLFNYGDVQGKMRKPKGTKPGEWGHYLDFAIIGPPHAPNYSVEVIPQLEEFLRRVGGYQGSYSYTYQTREEYRQMFDHTIYDQLRSELGGDKAFPESFDKVARNNQYTPTTERQEPRREVLPKDVGTKQQQLAREAVHAKEE
ncbi:uncharacterized protein VTP21DRAFT_10791 [Calcarisporiella thermophila]|uniref:uncharacterized protein n=1 Tax=Calcarisporiella thermophila TaxID=911321 RepID=UPI0037433294